MSLGVAKEKVTESISFLIFGWFQVTFRGFCLLAVQTSCVFLFFRISKGSGSSDFCQRYSGIFLMLRGCMVVQQMCRTDVIPLSAVTASFDCFRFLMSRSFSWRCRVRKDGKIY